jgi:APA family basic amino acid/polyamine antiporter
MSETSHESETSGVPAPVSGPPPQRTGPPDDAAADGRLGLPQATALIVGSIIGVGIFNLPGSLAAYGPITLFSMVLVTVGALALALLFASLSKRLPADGGPYAYSRAAFGNEVGFLNAWSYWITAWAGNAAIVTGWVLYVEYLLTKGGENSPLEKWALILVALIGLWVPALVNLNGVSNMASVQVVTTVLKFAALAVVSVVGLFFISTANFTPWNVSGGSNIAAIGTGLSLGVFSYLGVECAAVAAGKVRDPDRNVPRASVWGTLACAVVYLLSLFVVFGVVPTSELQDSNAPFATAVNTMFGGSWAGYVMAVAVVISGFGALNGWTMICAEMPLAAAKDGLFPQQFAHISRRGVPAFGIIASTVLASAFTVVSYLGSAGYTVFNTLVFMSGITAAIPYGFSALAQIKWRVQDNRKVHTPRFLRDVVIAVIAVVFSVLFIWYSRNTGESEAWKVWLPFIFCGAAFALGVPVYLAQRSHLTDPDPVPEYRA